MKPLLNRITKLERTKKDENFIPVLFVESEEELKGLTIHPKTVVIIEDYR